MTKEKVHIYFNCSFTDSQQDNTTQFRIIYLDYVIHIVRCSNKQPVYTIILLHENILSINAITKSLDINKYNKH